MDAVKAFNAELSSLYDVKPPISKAKMTALTRGAIKAIKFYKHVVQSVEKFILKCKPEYKVPGLYVIDSIVRQSRHQFGSEKDVFAPRFAKNMQQTFVNLYKCPAEDKSKVIRVLNLWQKNQVFAPDVIQPLFDLADPNHPMHKEVQVSVVQNNGVASTAAVKGSPAHPKTPTKTPSSTDPATLAHLGTIANNPYFQSALDSNTIAQLQQFHRILLRQNNEGSNSAKPEGQQQIHFDRKLLDFDYGSDEDEDPNANTSPKMAAANNPQAIDTVGSLLSNPEVLRQLQTLQQSMSNSGGQNIVHSDFDQEKMRKLQEMKQQEEEFDKHLAQTLPNLPFAAECEFKPNTNSPLLPPTFFISQDMSQPPPGYKPPFNNNNNNQVKAEGNDEQQRPAESEVEFVGENPDLEVIDIDHGDSRSPSRERYASSRRRRSRSRSRDRDRDNRNRRSRRSRSRSKTRKHRSRSRERERDKEKEKEKEKEREKERERRKRGLPPVKKENLSVCSTTLWVGHLSKLVHQEDLSDTFGEFGEIVSIDLIVPRGCAFIVMHRRQDAARCLTKLKNHKMHGKAITLAWAPGKGVKGKDLKDYWEGDLGVSYIPYSKLKPTMDLDLLEDGGMIDEDTAPDWVKQKMAAQPAKAEGDQPESKIVPGNSSSSTTTSFIQMPDGQSTVDTSQPPPLPNPGLLAAPPMTLPPLVPPFPLNNRLMGMPGMLPSVPMGVPPPNMPMGALLQNQMMGMGGSPFGQGMLPPPIPSQMSGLDSSAIESGNGPPPAPHNLPEQMLPFSIIPPHPPPPMGAPLSGHEDNMDLEMEDAEKSDPKMASPFPPMSNNSNGSFNGEPSLSSSMIKRDDDRSNHSRDRNRERNHGRRDSNRDGSGGRSSQRWGRDRQNESRDEKRDREKALNDRLRQMAGDTSFVDNNEEELPPSIQAPPMMDHPPPFPPSFNNNNGDGPLPENAAADRYGRRRLVDFSPAVEFDGPPIDYEHPPMDFDRPPLDYEHQRPPMDFDRPPQDYEGPPLDYEAPPPMRDFDGMPPRDFRPIMPPAPSDFEGPPIDYDGGYPPDSGYPASMDYDMPPRNFDGPPPHRGGVGGYPPMRGADRFDDRRRDFFPRDGMGPRGSRFRPAMDMYRGPRPHMFHQRGGGHMRGGPRGPLWMDRPNFPPRFDSGPPDFFRGGGGNGGPGPGFDDLGPPRHRHERRRSFRGGANDFDEQEERPIEERRTNRWSNCSPPPANKDFPEGNNGKSAPEQANETAVNSHSCEGDASDVKRESTTPLHDEPGDSGVSKFNEVEVKQEVHQEINEIKQEVST